MKKNKSILGIAILAFTMIITSCATTVTVSYMKPAKFNLSDYKNLAVATTEVKNAPIFTSSRIYIDYDNHRDSIRSGYDRLIPNEIADYYTSNVYSSLQKSGLFNLISPAKTDLMIKNLRYGISDSSKLYDMGADAIFTSEIEYLDYDEYPVYGDYIVIKNPNYDDDSSQSQYIQSDKRRVTIWQEAQMKISYSIIDLKDGTILASNSYTQTVKNSEDLNFYTTSLSAEWMFEDIADTFIEKTKTDLFPHTVYTSLELMDNKPKNSLANEAMKLVKNNQLLQAETLFEQAWNEDKHLPSGYNAALLIEAMGDRTNAMYLMKEIYNETGSVDAMTAYSRMKSFDTSSSAAAQQIED